MNKTNSFVNPFFIFLISIYQKFISPFFGKSCRFYPSCSDYCRQAIEKYGVIKGASKFLLRISRCHPYCSGGVDMP